VLVCVVLVVARPRDSLPTFSLEVGLGVLVVGVAGVCCKSKG
jgi:hypothetical protein